MYQVNLWSVQPSKAAAHIDAGCDCGGMCEYDMCNSGADYETLEEAEAEYQKDVEAYYVSWIEMVGPDGEIIKERRNGLYDEERDRRESEREEAEYRALCASEGRILYDGF